MFAAHHCCPRSCPAPARPERFVVLLTLSGSSFRPLPSPVYSGIRPAPKRSEGKRRLAPQQT